MSETLQVIKRAAELGLKHAQGSVFPIDLMEECFKYIIQQVEDYDGDRPEGP